MEMWTIGHWTRPVEEFLEPVRQHNTEVTVWMRRKKLDEESFLIRQWEILAVVTQSTPVAEAKGGWEGADSALRPTASGSQPRSAPPP